MTIEKTIIAVLCMVSKGTELLLQNRIAENMPGVNFPGGHVEPGESIVEAIVREMKEETGLDIEHLQLCGIKQIQTENFERYLIVLFKTKTYTGNLTSSKEGEVMWVDRKDFTKYELASGFEELLRVFDCADIQELVLRYNHETHSEDIEFY
jgi:8-oxo-dGTP diphosphatase